MRRSFVATAFLAVVFSVTAVQAQLEPITGQAPSGGLKPFSSADKARVEQLLKLFDPNSYDFHYQFLDASGKAQSTHVGMANLTQAGTVRAPGGAAAGTVNTINIFKQAGTVNTINIFKQAAGTVNTINIFKDAHQQEAAKELNSILQKYEVAPAPAIRAREAAVAPGVVIQGGMKPLSAQDKAKVDELLKSFDPNSYDFHYQFLDASGKSQSAHVGMANLTQAGTVRAPGGAAAGTVNTINIFKQAGTVNTINIFKQAAGTVNTINIFKDAHQQAAAQQLNEILKQYVH